MKKTISLILTLILAVGLFAGCSNGDSNQSIASEDSTSTVEQDAPAPIEPEPVAEEEEEETDTSNATVPDVQTIQLEVGQFEVYDFGEIKLHAYETKDPIADENFLLETADELIVIELIGFYDNIDEFLNYAEQLGKPINSVIVAYHPAGADAYSDTTFHADESLGEIALVAGFVEAFGADAYNGSVPETFELVETGNMTIGGVEFNVIETDDAFDLEIPAINTYFTHMLGASTHNILPSIEAMDAMIAQMKEIQAKGYALILTGHDVPRTIEIAAEKIDYLQKTKELAQSSESAEEFTAAMLETFPGYYGENYLEMSAGALFA